MVRLKDSRADLEEKPLHYFNSTMVRLKEKDKSCPAIFSNISIPLWYD